MVDPEAYTWDLLDSSLLQQLSSEKYVSISRRRRQANNALYSTPEPTDEEKIMASGDNGKGQDLWDTTGEGAESDDGVDPRSLFTINMPGVMSVKEVQALIDLGKWRTKIGSTLTELRVRRSSPVLHELHRVYTLKFEHHLPYIEPEVVGCHGNDRSIFHQRRRLRACCMYRS